MNESFHKFRKMLSEGKKPAMIEDIERMFGLGERTWEEGPNFEPNRIHLIGMFDIINKYIFEGKLDRAEPKEVIHESVDPSLKNVMAAFSGGFVKGESHKIILVKHAERSNFFNVFCAMIHEMIHFYDYMYGPMGKMVEKELVTGLLNWGPAYGSFEQNIKSAGLHPSQLPDDMPVHPAKQYQFPRYEFPDEKLRALANGEVVPGKQLMYPPAFKRGQYKLSESSMYDVHGRFFKLYADRANYIGFDVTETFEAWRPHKLRQTWESEETIPEPIKRFINRLDCDHKFVEFRNNENWFFEIN